MSLLFKNVMEQQARGQGGVNCFSASVGERTRKGVGNTFANPVLC